MKDLIMKTTSVETRNGSYTIDVYREIDSPIQTWTPVDRILEILELSNKDKKTFKKYVGSNCIKKVTIEDKKIELVDTLSLLRLNEFVLDEIFYRDILNMTVWKDNIWFDLNDLAETLSHVKIYAANKDHYYKKVNFYDRTMSEIYHAIENTDENLNAELKLCLQKRRLYKIKNIISDCVLELGDENKITNIIENMKYKIKVNQEKRYNSRLTPEEQIAWESELIENGIKEKEPEIPIEELAMKLKEGLANG